MGRCRRARPRVCERIPRSRRAQGRQRRSPRAQHPELGLARLRARADRCRRHSGVRLELVPRRRLSPRTLGGGRDRVRGRRSARQGRGRLRRAPGAATRHHVSRPRRARRARARPRRIAPDRTRRRDSRGHRGRPVHDHLHVRDDRAAQGLHALEPQLLRDGERRRPHARLLPRRRPDAPVPAPRPQLRAADAAARREGRFHDRVPLGPAARRRGAAAGAADAASERATCVREGVLVRPVPVRRDDGCTTQAHRLGARRRARGQQPRGARRAGTSRAARQARRSPTVSSSRRSARPSEAASGCPARAERRSRRRSPSSSTPSACGSRRGTASPSAPRRAA